ncbi:MAG: hypothetical protein R3B90_01905 [Planctomycetaceae bacterium]|jgi:cell division protein FtsL
MYTRFAAVLTIIVAIALAGIAVEKRNLWLRRALTLQEYRLQELERERTELRLAIEQLTAPQRLVDQFHDERRN